MLKVTNTYLSEKLAAQRHFTGLVYELEDGSYFVTAQDGYVQPGAIYTADQLAEQEDKAS
jgi:hypothetical protein